jgi:hypothetical protein
VRCAAIRQEQLPIILLNPEEPDQTKLAKSPAPRNKNLPPTHHLQEAFQPPHFCTI